MRKTETENLPTDYCYRVGLVEAYTALLGKVACWMVCWACTSQIEQVRLLVELVEDGTRSVLQITRCEDRNAITRKLSCKRCASVMIVEGSDAWCDCIILALRSRCCFWIILTFASLDEMRMSLVQRLAELQLCR